MLKRASETPGGEDGWALVAVLWITSVLAVLALAAQNLALSSHTFERKLLQRDRTNAILDAGLARAIYAIGDPSEQNRWPVDGTPRAMTFDGAVLRITVQDVLGLIDLNAADGSVINRLLRANGATEELADTLTDRILDWRSANGMLKRLHGASDADYDATGKGYYPRHGAFQSVDELKLVLGMTRALFARIKDALTVYSHRPMIDPTLASPEVLHAMYVSDLAVEDQLRNRIAGGSHISSAIALGGRSFRIAVRADKLGPRAVREAVVMLTGSSERPYLMQNWR